MIRIIHTADWQLGKPFGRFSQDVRSALAEARLDAIDRLSAAAKSQEASHVVVAGDVFDNVEPGDRIVTQALSRMARSPVTWWLMPGNHDHARAGGLWSRIRDQAPPSVRVVDIPEAIEMEEGAWLLPAPLEYRRTVSDPTAAMVEMTTPPGALRIGLAHGSITEFSASGDGSNLIPPDRATSAGLDYLALGDWHGFLMVGDRTAYSGTPEIDRFGREEPGSCISLSLRSNSKPEIQRIEIGWYRWLSRSWNVQHTDDLERELTALRSEARMSDILFSLHLTGVASLSDRIAMKSTIEGQIAHEVRHIDFNVDGLFAQPTAEDIAQIDVQGALARATAALQARAAESDPKAYIAVAALERLYVEAMRLDAEFAR